MIARMKLRTAVKICIQVTATVLKYSSISTSFSEYRVLLKDTKGGRKKRKLLPSTMTPRDSFSLTTKYEASDSLYTTNKEKVVVSVDCIALALT
jgi:hypothetical protein